MCPVRNARLYSTGMRGTGKRLVEALMERGPHVEDVESRPLMTHGERPLRCA